MRLEGESFQHRARLSESIGPAGSTSGSLYLKGPKYRHGPGRQRQGIVSPATVPIFPETAESASRHASAASLGGWEAMGDDVGRVQSPPVESFQRSVMFTVEVTHDRLPHHRIMAQTTSLPRAT